MRRPRPDADALEHLQFHVQFLETELKYAKRLQDFMIETLETCLHYGEERNVGLKELRNDVDFQLVADMANADSSLQFNSHITAVAVAKLWTPRTANVMVMNQFTQSSTIDCNLRNFVCRLLCTDYKNQLNSYVRACCQTCFKNEHIDLEMADFICDEIDSNR